MRPPPLEDVGADSVRSDLKSEDMLRVHPDLPSNTPAARHMHLKTCDMLAYRRIQGDYPDLLPPWVGDTEKGTPSSSLSSLSSTTEGERSAL